MLHLRIVVPSYQSEHALDLLDNTPSVCNLIFLERAAKRPEGDVILCDVAREDASVIIADLRELDIDTEGSIAIEEIDSEISVARRARRALSTRPGARAGRLGGAQLADQREHRADALVPDLHVPGDADRRASASTSTSRS